MRYLLSILFFVLMMEAQAQDLALQSPSGSFQSPVSGCSLTTSENVTIQLFNWGATLAAGSSFNVSYSINGGAPVTEMVILGSSLLSHSSYIYTFATQANLSAPGTYSFDASVSFAGDVNPQNDMYAGYAVNNSGVSAGGTVSADQTVCSGSNSGTMLLAGNTGTVKRWEVSEDGGLTWLYVSQTTSQQNFLNLVQSTSYRAVVQSGLCPDATSAAATVTVSCGLPLTWLGFSGAKENNNAVLKWKTANEINTVQFVIERQQGNNGFRNVGTVAAQHSSSGNSYRFTDINIPGGLLSYRIRQIDADGKSSFSSIVTIQSTIKNGIGFIVNNPLKDDVLTISLESGTKQKVKVSVFGSTGQKLVPSQLKWLDARVNFLSIPLHRFAAGVYYVVIEAADFSWKQKFVISR